MVVYYSNGVSIGNLTGVVTTGGSEFKSEISGITITSKNPTVIWCVDDGFHQLLNAISITDASALGSWTIGEDNAIVSNSSSDWEDLSSAYIGGVNYLYIADIGDNGAARTNKYIYRIVEPTVTGSNGTVNNVDIVKITFTYSDATNRDAECIFVDPSTGDIYIISKREAVPKVFKIDHAATYPSPVSAVYLGTMWDIPDFASPSATGNVVGGCISSDGNKILIKGYNNIWLFERTDGQTIYQALGNTPTELSCVGQGSYPNREPQSEAIAFDSSGNNFYTVSEYHSSSSSSHMAVFKYTKLNSQPIGIQILDGTTPLTAGGTYDNTHDTYIWGTNPSTSYGTATSWIADLPNGGNPSSTDTRTGLLKFDSLNTIIPSNATIRSAVLTLHINTEGLGYELNRVLVENWTESSTFTSVSGPVLANGTDATAAYDGRSSGSANYIGQEIVRFNTHGIATIQGWLDGTITNRGWVVTPLDANGTQFTSQNSGAIIKSVIYDANAIVGVSNGATLATWTDTNGVYNATQATEANKPTYVTNALDGKPVVRFTPDGTNSATASDYMVSNAFNVTNHGYTIFAVVTCNATAYTNGPGGRVLYSTHSSGGTTVNDVVYVDGANGYLKFMTDTTLIDTSVNNSTFLLTIERRSGNGTTNANTVTGYLNGTQKATLNTLTFFSASTQFSLGQEWDTATPSDFWDGDIAEFIIVPGRVTSAQRQQAEGYLAHKWGLEGNLPSYHAYKTTDPGSMPTIVYSTKPQLYIEYTLPADSSGGGGVSLMTQRISGTMLGLGFD